MSTWNIEREIHLIYLHQENPFLWDQHHEKFFQKDAKQEALIAIAKEIGGVDVEAVKTKFRNLRTTFMREEKRVRETANTDQPYQPRWEHYERMDFLKDVYRSRAPRTPRNRTEEHFEDPNEITVLEVSSHSFSDLLPNSDFQTDHEDSYESVKEEDDDTNGDMVSAISKMLDRKRDPLPGESEDIFGRHVASSLKEMSKHHREMAKVAIQQTLCMYAVSPPLGKVGNTKLKRKYTKKSKKDHRTIVLDEISDSSDNT